MEAAFSLSTKTQALTPHILPPGIPAQEKLTLVGGILTPEGRLSTNDGIYVEHVLRILSRFSIPVSADPALDVMNIEGLGHGGKRDFLQEKISTDILIMANVAYRQSEGGNYLNGIESSCLYLREKFQLETALRVSPHNANQQLWQRQFTNSGANVIFVIGDDDFPPQKIMGDDYVALADPAAGVRGILFSRAWLKSASPFLKAAKSPIADVATVASSCLDAVEFMRRDRGERLCFEAKMDF